MTYLAIQNTYDEVQIALCHNQTIHAETTINKMYASAQCIPALDTLLKEHSLSINDLVFIVANCGPGPFTTLRVVLATVNGIHAASGIPLIGIDALEALLQEHAHTSYPTIALLNAFNQDVYYAINPVCPAEPAVARQVEHPDQQKGELDGFEQNKGCQNINTLMTELATLYPQQSLYFIGNGARMHQTLITEMFGSYAHIPDPLPETASLDQVQRMGFKAWQEGKGQKTPLVPHYLKSAAPR